MRKILQKKHALQQLSNPSQLSQQQSSSFLSFFSKGGFKVILESEGSSLFSIIGEKESVIFDSIELYKII